jgi:hypothetical protein
VIDLGEGYGNAADAMHVNSEFVSSEKDERDFRDRKHLEPRIWT